MGLDKSNFIVRSLSGLVYAGLLVGAIVLGSIASSLLFALFALLATYEFESNLSGGGNKESWKIFWLADATSIVFMILGLGLNVYGGSILVALSVLLIFLRFILQVFVPQKNPIRSISVFSLELLYICLPLSLLAIAVWMIPNPWIIICMISMIWISDTGAYIVGSLLGRHKMFPRLSPKKSWEGFFGGLAFNIGASFIFFYCFKLNTLSFISNVEGWIFIGICVTVFATVGDLFESMLKRAVKIKDFGNFIPGHGGILDRIDSLLCVVPALVIVIYFTELMFGV